VSEPPANLLDESLLPCLHAEYGLHVAELRFLPVGQNSSAWVYRVRATDDATYFLEVGESVTNPAGLLVPRFLRDEGIAPVVASLPTTTKGLWAEGARLRLAGTVSPVESCSLRGM
jgi:spectinomycin phosphotransferase